MYNNTCILKIVVGWSFQFLNIQKHEFTVSEKNNSESCIILLLQGNSYLSQTHPHHLGVQGNLGLELDNQRGLCSLVLLCPDFWGVNIQVET